MQDVILDSVSKAAWMSRKRMEVTFFFLQASLIFWATRCMASMVHLPGQPPKWVGGSRLCFSARKERLAVTSVENNFPKVLSRPMGQ